MSTVQQWKLSSPLSRGFLNWRTGGFSWPESCVMSLRPSWLLTTDDPLLLTLISAGFCQTFFSHTASFYVDRASLVVYNGVRGTDSSPAPAPPSSEWWVAACARVGTHHAFVWVNMVEWMLVPIRCVSVQRLIVSARSGRGMNGMELLHCCAGILTWSDLGKEVKRQSVSKTFQKMKIVFYFTNDMVTTS